MCDIEKLTTCYVLYDDVLFSLTCIDLRLTCVTVCVSVCLSVCAGGGGGQEPQTPAQNFDYDFAREELVMKELGDNPIQTAIERLEHHHQQDKQSERAARER